jgi:exopolysaccharide biosynthesis WecB/TagA/CpsF family protein
MLTEKTSEIINTPDPEMVYLAGWPHVKLTRKGFAQLMVRDCLIARSASEPCLPKLGFSMNGQAVSLCSTSAPFSDAMKQADYIQADGESLVKASRVFSKGNELPERIATTDFFHDAAEHAVKYGLKFYMLGASEEMSLEAEKNIRKQYPDLQIVGRRNGYFEDSEEEQICKEIVASGADVLWVGMGKPKEQLFCIRNKERLKGVPWIKSCGGLFDFLSGRNKRAPQWVQDAGLEWAHRTLGDPKRFLWRYLTTNIHTIILLIRGSKDRGNI